MNHARNGVGNPSTALIVEDQFFDLLGKLTERSLPRATPLLVRLLQYYDQFLGLRCSSVFTAAMDVRVFYAVFNKMKKSDRSSRRVMVAKTAQYFEKGQLEAIARRRLRLVKGATKERKPVALMPVVRVP